MGTIMPNDRHARIQWENGFESAWHRRVLNIQSLISYLKDEDIPWIKMPQFLRKLWYWDSPMQDWFTKAKRFLTNEILVGLNEMKLQWAEWHLRCPASCECVTLHRKGQCRSHCSVDLRIGTVSCVTQMLLMTWTLTSRGRSLTGIQRWGTRESWKDFKYERNRVPLC